MDCKKLFSKLLAKFLLVNVGVSCFGCCTYTMEQQDDSAMLESIKKFTRDFLRYKSRKLVDDHKAVDYESALLEVCSKIDESFKKDLVDFIKQKYSSLYSYDAQELHCVMYRLSYSGSLDLLRKFSMEFLNESVL